jgi:hypothetical protein
VAADGKGSVGFYSATNVQQLVLAYFTPSVPDGHVLEAGAILSDKAVATISGILTDPQFRIAIRALEQREGVDLRPEAEVHTSMARAANYNKGNCRWDFPESFTANEMQLAVDQINELKKRPLILVPRERTPLFAVTNAAGALYQGFFELLARPSETKSTTGEEKFSENLPRKEENPEIARLKLGFAEQNVKVAQKKNAVGVIGPLELEKAIADRDIAAAELKGDAVEVARIKLRIAELELSDAEKRHAVGRADSDEYAKVKLARDIAAIRLQEALKTK